MDAIKTLQKRDYSTRRSYVSTIVSLVAASSTITPDLLRRIYQLFAQADLTPEDRLKVLASLFFGNNLPSNSVELIDDKDMAFSAVKDALYFSENSDSKRAELFVQGIVEKFGITEEQLSFLRSWTDWENRILVKLGKPGATVSEADMPVDLAKKATALGIPVVALYFSGSIIGLGAAGITSGLATLGAASGFIALGLNPMTAGIVALIAGGITIKKLLDAILPSGGENKEVERKRTELEQEARRLKVLRHRYVTLLETDTKLFSGGPWWELFTGRRRKRRMAVQSLLELAANEKSAFDVARDEV